MSIIHDASKCEIQKELLKNVSTNLTNKLILKCGDKINFHYCEYNVFDTLVIDKISFCIYSKNSCCPYIIEDLYFDGLKYKYEFFPIYHCIGDEMNYWITFVNRYTNKKLYTAIYDCNNTSYYLITRMPCDKCIDGGTADDYGSSLACGGHLTIPCLIECEK